MLEEEEIDKRVRSFFWPVKMEDIETTEEGKLVVPLHFPSGRWVPSTLLSATKWIHRHENAAALREYGGTYILAQMKLNQWADKFEEDEEVPPTPDDWLEGPLVYDVTDDTDPPIETEVTYYQSGSNMYYQ